MAGTGLHVGIDASNLRTGGGLTHIREILNNADPVEVGIDAMTVWANRFTLEGLPTRPWLERVHVPLLDGPLPARLYWQRFMLAPLASRDCDILFVPGGVHTGGFHPNVTMCRNMLPFDLIERRRFGFRWRRLRFALLERAYTASFRDSDGVIFLTESAKSTVERRMGPVPGKVTMIPHGVSGGFRRAPRYQLPIEDFTPQRPFRLLYVSIVNQYKHQWHVVEAIAQLQAEGLPVSLELVGPSYAPALRRLQSYIARFDPEAQFVTYQGRVPYDELGQYYHAAHGFVFASSCENMPNILLEAMASGLPIACSNRSPMPEILGDGGVYFDPEHPISIDHAIRELLVNRVKRARLAEIAFHRAEQFSWQECARLTLSFLSHVALEHRARA